MFKICLCIKIHIPAVQANYRFSDIRENHRYYDDHTVAEHVQNVYKNNLAPFFAGIRSVYYQSHAKFKAGISISGISLTLLQKHAPKAVEELIQLQQRGCVEILSEPWSHSVLPHLDLHTLERQVDLHDKTVYALFGKIPDIFAVHSPTFQNSLPQMISRLGKKALFTNLNPIDANSFKDFLFKNANDQSIAKVLPANHKLSRMLQKIDLNPFIKSTSEFSNRIISQFKNSITDSNPVIIFYNITSAKSSFRLSRAVTWKRILMDLLTDPGVTFISPSKTVKNYSPIVNKNSLSRNVLHRSRITDMWLQNKLQNEAFGKQLKINTLMKTEIREAFLKEWDMLQDMEYLYYMDNHFNKKDFFNTHYTPFSSPNLAFINYINVLNDFEDKLQNNNINIIKTAEYKTTQQYSEE